MGNFISHEDICVNIFKEAVSLEAGQINKKIIKNSLSIAHTVSHKDIRAHTVKNSKSFQFTGERAYPGWGSGGTTSIHAQLSVFSPLIGKKARAAGLTIMRKGIDNEP